MHRFALLGYFCVYASLVSGQALPGSINPKIRKIVDDVSRERIIATLQKLESFGTRSTLSKQVVPAREWIAGELRGYSPRLQVSFDSHRVKKSGRITRDVEMANVVAVLPGLMHPDQQILVTAHYDTMVIRNPTGSAGEVQPLDPESLAPGVNDDGSGTAAVMELARVMSAYEFDKTIVFVLFVAEEQGLVGATLYAQDARKANRQIEAVLNNDIIGSSVSGNGETDSHTVRVFSDDPADSPSRSVARYVKEIGERYVPGMNIDLVFRSDRWFRGGDHTPFVQQGYAGVRFSSAEEDYSHQHTATDTLANMDPAYATRVAKINAAAAASLAWAPNAPGVMEPSQREADKGRLVPMIGRGKSRYDAQLRWKTDGQESDLVGYNVMMRPSREPMWTRRIFVGKVSEYLMPGVSIDDYIFGVQAVDKNGNESLVNPYVAPPRQILKIETY